jgi:hypothetical protein
MKNSLAHLLLAASLLGMVACSSARKAAEAPKSAVGAWDILVSGTPMGNIPAELLFEQDGEAYKGFIATQNEKSELRNLKVADNKVTGSFYSQAYGADIYFNATYNPEMDTIEGWVMDEFKLTGKRKAAEGK